MQRAGRASQEIVRNAPLRLTRRLFCVGGAALAASPLAAAPRKGGYVFAYFRNADDGRAGMRLAISRDGRKFTALRNGEPMIVPQVGENKLMRDPCVAQDPRSGLYHMVWTTGWTGITIGHASSPDLANWSAQQAVPVMQDFAGTHNTWAPELIYDPPTRRFVIVWASTVAGASPATTGMDPKLSRHRIYATTTADFTTFSPTQLLFDPGFSVIDATFLRKGRKLYMFFKDETETPARKHIQWCEAASPLGPFGPLSAPITAAWAEGPTAFRVDDEIFVFYDRYMDKRYGAVATRDMVYWRDASPEIAVPDGASHGTIIPVDGARYAALQQL